MAQSDILNAPTDDLSAFSHRILKLNGATAYTQLVVRGDGDIDAKAILDMAQPTELLSVPIADPQSAQAMLAGLWLWHDWLADSHRISQGVGSETGSFWHAIMHRREGDFSNSRYWYSKCRSHPILAALHVQAAQMLNPLPADKTLLRVVSDGWNPDVFVDLVRTAHEQPADPRRSTVIALQRLEWRLLFEHCARAAARR